MAEIKKEILEDNEKQLALFRASKISIILDDYNDLFSDFDPRSYAIRAISHDFLQEARSAAKDKALGQIELDFLVPLRLRSFKDEATIKKRLRDYFKKHHDSVHQEVKTIRKRGAIMAFVGALLGVFATFANVLLINDFFRSALIILLEPASWFLIWTGFDHIFFVTSPKKQELSFYEKMMHAPINFTGY